MPTETEKVFLVSLACIETSKKMNDAQEVIEIRMKLEP